MGLNEQSSLDDRGLRSPTMAIHSTRWSSTKGFCALKEISDGERKMSAWREQTTCSVTMIIVYGGDIASETRSRTESSMLRGMVNEEEDIDLNGRERFPLPSTLIMVENGVTMRGFFVEKSFMTLEETCGKGNFRFDRNRKT